MSPPRAAAAPTGMSFNTGPPVDTAEAIAAGLRYAHELRVQGQLGQSIQCLEELLQAFPRHGTIRYRLSLLHRQTGNYAESIRFCDEILADQPGNIAALGGRVETAIRLDSPEKALAFLDQACQAAPDHLPFQVRRCGLLRQTGCIAQARDLVAELHRRHGDDPDVLTELAFVAQANGDHLDCLAACEAALARVPGDLRLVLARINALTGLQRYDDALAQAEAFLEQTPDNPALLLRKGNLLRQLGRIRDSIALLAALARQHPQNVHILLNLAHSHRHGQQHEANLEVLDRLLALDPHHQGALLARVEALRLAGRTGESVRMLQEISDRLAGVTLPAQRLPLGVLLCRGLVHLADDQAADLLRRHCDTLAALAPAMPSDLLWQVYRKADTLGLGAMFDALARALFDQETVRLDIARSVLQASYRAGLPQWRRIGTHLATRVPAQDQSRIRMDLAALADAPGRALTLRGRRPTMPRAEAALQIAGLLRQQGRIRLAARYLGLVWRRHPENPAVLRDYLSSLCGAGLGAVAGQVLEDAALRQPDLPPAWRRVIAQGWAELDQLHRATAIWTAGGAAMIPHADWYVANALSMAKGTKLAALRQRLWQDNRRTHLAPSLQGFLLAEAAQLPAPDIAGADLTLKAMAVLARWIDAPDRPVAASPQPVPRSIIQFWSQGHPPPQVCDAVATWQAATGFAHRLFDHQSAQDFLLERLGPDWLRAFGRAGSATEESDFFRLCHIGLHGGIYADCDDWLTGDAAELVEDDSCLTLYREPTGAVGNNLIIAPPRHPAILWAALCAKRALEERHNETIWGKTGPGLLTRAVAWHIQTTAGSGTAPSLRILPRWQLGRTVQFHSPLSYKASKSYWNRRDAAGGLTRLAANLPPKSEPQK